MVLGVVSTPVLLCAHLVSEVQIPIIQIAEVIACEAAVLFPKKMETAKLKVVNRALSPKSKNVPMAYLKVP